MLWIARDYSGLLGIAKAGDGKLFIKLVKSTKVIDKVCDKASPVPYCVVFKEGNLVYSAAMGRWHTLPTPSGAGPTRKQAGAAWKKLMALAGFNRLS